MQIRPTCQPSSLLTVLALLSLLAAPLAGVDFGSRSVPLFETAEWSFTDTSVSGEPFWHYGTVVFTHTATGAQRTTTTFYDGDDSWRFRFFATRRGEWTFVSTAADPDQAGHTGSVNVGDPAAGKLGPIIPLGDRYVRRDGDGGLRAAYLQVFQYGSSYGDENSALPGLRLTNYAAMSQSDREALLTEHLDAAEQHGMTGIFVLTDGWAVGDTGLPNLDRFRLFDWYIGEIWKRNLHLHTWMWSENNDLARWGSKELYRYMAARTGPLGSWSADRTWDTSGPDGHIALSMATGSDAWAEMLTAYASWPKMVSERSDSNAWFGYVSNDIRFGDLFANPSIEGYPADRPLSPYHVTRWLYDELPHGKPHFYMRRHWHQRSGALTTDNTVQALWEFMFAGGAADDWGVGGDSDMPYPGFERMVHVRRFLRDAQRWRLDLEPVDGSSSAHMLANASREHVLLYQRGTDSITVDLGDGPSGLPIIALDTESLTYAEIDLGTIGGGEHTIDLPATSNWAVAIGDFADEYRVRQIDAGPDRFIRDIDGDGSASVQLLAAPDTGITDVTWSWSGGSASGADVQLSLPIGEHAITCTGVNPDGPDAVDTAYIRVIDEVEPGVLYIVGESTWYEAEDLTIGPAVVADNSWRVKSDADKDGSPTSAGQYLNGRGNSGEYTPWAEARIASVTIDMAVGRSLKVYARTFGGGGEQDLMVGLDGDFHAYGGAYGSFRRPWAWTIVDEPLFIPAGRHELQFRQALNADLDCFHLGNEDRLPSSTGGSTPVLTDEILPAVLRTILMQDVGDWSWDCTPPGTVIEGAGTVRFEDLDAGVAHTLAPVQGSVN